ncbi:MAG: FAD-dependent oxidoreductase, partial [Pseudomonadota bacterium]
IIGAGISGLAAADRLRLSGHSVTLFDKSRGVGGRMATRRSDHGSFDHGAQYFTVRDGRFAAQVDRWEKAGIVGRWEKPIVTLSHTGEMIEKPGRRMVAVPGMSAIPKAMAGAHDIRLSVVVSTQSRTKGGLALTSSDDEPLGVFDRVIVTVPPVQAVPLLQQAPDLAVHAKLTEMDPCWTLMATFPNPIGVAFGGALMRIPSTAGGNALAWVARDGSKPGREASDEGGAETWVMQATPHWSRDMIELESDVACEQLLAAFHAVLKMLNLPSTSPSHAVAHRWRYARPTASAPVPPIRYDFRSGIAIAGDWCRGPRVEDAYLSGLETAETVLAS